MKRGPKCNPIDEMKALELYEAGHTFAEIGRAMGVCESTISKRLREVEGFHARRPGQRGTSIDPLDVLLEPMPLAASSLIRGRDAPFAHGAFCKWCGEWAANYPIFSHFHGRIVNSCFTCGSVVLRRGEEALIAQVTTQEGDRP